MKRKYRDLAEFDLPLVGPDAPTFGSLVRDIEDRPQPFASWPTGDLDTAAVLLNQSGKAIITLVYIWRYTTAEGETRISHHSNLGSSVQMEVLCGRAEVRKDLGSFILPGSKRLITEHGMFGSNLDVLPPDFAVRGGSYARAGGGSWGLHQGSGEDIAEIELCLDVAILEDGLCVGPDHSGLFQSVTADLERRRDTAQEIVTALRNGASEGQIFEVLLPLARKKGTSLSPLLGMFAKMSIHHLVNTSSSQLLVWFENNAEPPRTRLYRPS